jgi:cephalosporin hydroxylase
VSWLGIPIIQLPEDILMMQELIWQVRPDVVIESGVAHGGSLVLYASMLELIGKGRAVGVDIEIREHNRLAMEAHPMFSRIELIEGDSLADDTVSAVRKLIGPGDSVLVALDSNHSKAHVLGELERYAPLVTPRSYIVVFDGVMPLIADAPHGDPTWSTDNPAAAAHQYMDGREEFELDPHFTRLGVTYCQSGFWRRRA